MLPDTALGYLLKARPGTEGHKGRKPGCLATGKLNTSIVGWNLVPWVIFPTLAYCWPWGLDP